MGELPETGSFKIGIVGQMKSGTSKKGNAWRVFTLQFDGDPQWYDTFWTLKEEPAVGMELKGKKSFDEEFTAYKFDIERDGGKNNWNPASANATVVMASVEIVNGFLALGDHYAMWLENKAELKPLFTKYVATVGAASKQLKDLTVGMGSIGAEAQAGVSGKPQSSGDPGPTPPPTVATYPGDEEELPI